MRRWRVGVLGFCIALPGLAISIEAGDGRWQANVPSGARQRPNPMANEASAIAAGAKLFQRNCASCHGKDGRAKSLHAKHVHAREFTDAAWQAEVSDERLFNSISNGKGKMPSFKSKLSEDQIDALVRYVRQFKK